MLEDTILKFINDFKKDNEEYLIDKFTRGYCYHFAVILNSIGFGDIVYNQVDNHFAYYDYNHKRIYDITGIIGEKTSDWCYWKDFWKDEPYEALRIERNCIYKY